MKFRKLLLSFATIMAAGVTGAASDFVTVRGHDLIKPDGNKLFIQGTNLGNWVNPEGYMFGFKRTNSPSMIDNALCQLAGPDATAEFWRRFRDSYITKADIDFIASAGANTIRLPFHYKLFTTDPYMGSSDPEEGFRMIDRAIGWCRDNNLYLILDMHDCPGGQTGDNIDDSYGYPWLMVSEPSQQLFCDLWKRIAARYKDEPVILGYELMNEPVATYFGDDEASLNAALMPLYKRALKAIREVDTNHIVLLGGAQWNGNFHPLTDLPDDPQLMLTCHRYGGDPTPAAIRHFIDTRDASGLPMYMGEIGHNTDQWQATFVKTMKDNNIGYTFWPYKKRDSSCMNAFSAPADWQYVIDFAEAPRGSYQEIRDLKPDHARAAAAMNALLDSVRFDNCTPQPGYINSLGLK